MEQPGKPAGSVFVSGGLLEDYEKYLVKMTSSFVPDLLEPVRLDSFRNQTNDGALTILDAAAGTGAVALYLADKYPGKDRIIATDNSNDMLEYLRSKARAQGHNNISGLVADFLDMSAVPDASCDVVLVNFGIFFVAPPVRHKAWLELARVMKPHAVISLSIWRDLETTNWLVNSTLAAFPDFDVSKSNLRLLTHLGKPEDIEREMTAAGFENISTKPVFHRVMFPRQKFISLTVDNAFLKNNFPDPEKRARIVEAAHKLLDSKYAADVSEVPFEGTAFIAVAKKKSFQ